MTLGIFNHPGGCLAWGVPALEPACCCVGPVLLPKWCPSGELTPMNILWGPHQCPYSEPQTFPTSQETLQDLQVGLAQASVESLLCSGSQCTWNLVCILQEQSLSFPQSCIAPALKSHWPSIPDVLAALPPNARPWGWDSELSLLWENLWNTIIFSFVGHSPGRYGIWLYHKSAPPTILLWLLCLLV